MLKKTEEKDVEIAKFKKMDSKQLLEKFKKPEIFIKLFESWKAEFEQKPTGEEWKDEIRALHMEDDAIDVTSIQTWLEKT